MAGGNNKASSSNPPPSRHGNSRWDPSPSSAVHNNDRPSSSTPIPQSTVSASNDSKLSSPNPNPSPSSSNNNLTPKHGGVDSAKTNPSPRTRHHANILPDSTPCRPFSPPMDPPPQPSYGLHMLERRTVALADGSVRTFMALPPDYQDFIPPPRALLPLPRFPPMAPEFGAPFPPLRPMSPDVFRRHYEQSAWSRDQPHWHPLGIDGVGDGPPPVSVKRKRGEERDGNNHELPLKAQQGLQFGDASTANNSGETSSSNKPAKIMRVDAFDSSVDDFDASHHYHRVDPDALKKAILKFAKLLNENLRLKKNCLQNGKFGHLPCIACERSYEDFPDVHALVVHAYNLDNADLRADHLGLHKALCILMGWNFMRLPDNSMAYQFLPSDVAAANQDDLILWPPVVMIHNTSTGKVKDGRMDGYGNKAMERILKGFGFRKGKCRSLYSKEGHRGIVLVKFAADQSGLREAIRMATFFERENHGREAWAEVQSMLSATDYENHPKLLKVDERTGERKKIFYGHLVTAFDLDKVDQEGRKKAVVESKRERLQAK